MKVLVIFLLLCSSLVSVQANYDVIDIQEITISAIRLNDAQLLKVIGKPKATKLYTPPEGDTDVYDKIEYLTFDSISVTSYVKGKEKWVASISIESSGIIVGLGGVKIKVGDSVNALKVFTKSSGAFDVEVTETSSKARSGKMHFHLTNNHRLTDGIVTIGIVDGRIRSVSINLDPA